jgi:hypothetical protein
MQSPSGHALLAFVLKLALVLAIVCVVFLLLQWRVQVRSVFLHSQATLLTPDSQFSASILRNADLLLAVAE